MRVVLVIKEARGDVGNERGRVLLKDVEHVASMFRSLENLKSVGLIVTSEPRGLMNPDMAGMVSHSMHSNFQELLETAKAEDEFVDLSPLVKNWFQNVTQNCHIPIVILAKLVPVYCFQHVTLGGDMEGNFQE